MAALAALVAPIMGGIGGSIASAGDKNQALQLQQNALNDLRNLNTPEAAQLAVILQQYQNAGQLSPQMQQTISQAPSAMNNVQTDPRLMNAAMQSLQTLQKTGSGALRPEDMAALDQIRDASNNQAQAQKQSILQSMAARGLGGSGAEFAAQLSAGQNAANRSNEQDQQVGANASQRALQAIAQAGNLGTSLQGQQFGQQSQIAAANDAIGRYNAMNAQQTSNANVNALNSAQASNLANKQNIANMNTGVLNQQSMYNAQLPQTVYQDQLAKFQAAAGQGNTVANQYSRNAANTQQQWAGMGQGVGQGASAYASNSAKNNNGTTYYDNNGNSSQEEE